MPYWHALGKARPKHFLWKLSSKPKNSPFTIYLGALVITLKLNPLSLTLPKIFFLCQICSINMSNFEPRPIFFYNFQPTCFGCNNARLWIQERECEQGHVNLEESILFYFLPCRHNMLKILSNNNILPCGLYTYIHKYLDEQTCKNLVMDVVLVTSNW